MLARVVKVISIRPNRIVLVLRYANGSKGSVEVLGFRPHFYVQDIGDYQSLFGEKLKIVFVSDFGIVPAERAKYQKHYQADIPYTRNFLLCTGIRNGVLIENPERKNIGIDELIPADASAIKTRRCFIDIEVAGEGSLDTVTTPAPVVAVSAWDSYTQEYFTVVVGKGTNKPDEHIYFAENESELFQMLLAYFKSTDPDVLVGWNISYDADYLRNRAHKLGFQLSLPEIFDLKEADKRLHKRLSYSLKDVAVEEGFAKESDVVTAVDAIDRYEHGDVEFLIRYNRSDVEFIVKIDKKYNLVDFFEGLKDHAGVVHYTDTLKFSVLIDTMLLRLARELGVVLPSAPDTREDEDSNGVKYEGAIVSFFTPDESPRRGIYENVAVFDFSRYYPSLIKTLNISPEVSGPSDKPGIIPKLVDKLFAERDKLEAKLEQLIPGTAEYDELKRKRDVVKFLTNACYGYVGASFTRLFSLEKAAKVTEAGRKGLKHMANYIRSLSTEKEKYEPLYGDTDSIFVQVPFEKTEALQKALNEEIERYFREEYGVRECKVKMDLNYYAKRILFSGVKKRYAAHVIWQHKPCDYLRVVGYEAIRSDQSKFTQETQKKLFDLILRGTREQVIEFVRAALKNFRKQPLEYIAFRKGIERPLDQYGIKKGTGVPSHIRGAIYSNEVYGTNFNVGSKPLYLYVKGIAGKPPTDIVAFERKPPEGCVVDWDRMAELTLRGKISEILDAVGITWDEIIGKIHGRQRSLVDFVNFV